MQLFTKSFLINTNQLGYIYVTQASLGNIEKY